MSATWKIVACNYSKSLGGEVNVITNMHYEILDEKTVGENTFRKRIYGSVTIDTSDLSNFIAYNSVTEANAIDWVKTALGSDEVTAAEASLVDQIAEKQFPTTGTGIPWSE